MRFPNKRAWRALALFVGASGSAGVAQQAPVGTPPGQMPPPDLPVATGPSATSQTSADAPRYDEVGYAGWFGDELRHRKTASGDPDDPGAITAASRSLPTGSFAEVTALDSGRTVLVEMSDRGPPRADRLIDLSPGAATLLGIDRKSTAAVRVRQVDPPAADQVALKQGHPAGPRLDSPPILLAGLRARLKDAPATPTPVSGNAPTIARSTAPAPVRRRMVATFGKPSPTDAARDGPAGAPSPTAKSPTSALTAASPKVAVPASGRYVVQVGAFSNAANARALAARLDGHAIASGKLTRVELGPFADSTAANRARDGVAKRGYGDARVVRKD